MKKFFALLLSLVMVIGLVACGNDSSSTDSSTEESSGGETDKEPWKIALILPGVISDGGWNAGAYGSLEYLENAIGAETHYNENTTNSDAEEVIRNYATAGYDIIICHGSQFADQVMNIAPDFTDTRFIINSAVSYQEPNVCSLNLDYEQVGFLAGAMAALMSESGIVASMSGPELYANIHANVGFINGATYVNPDIDARVCYVEDTADLATAKELAKAYISEGVDVIRHGCDEAGLGVIEACEESGIYAIGNVLDQTDISPAVCTSIAQDLYSAIGALVESWWNGEPFVATSNLFGIADGNVGMCPYSDSVPQEVIDKMDTIVEGLKDGSIDATEGPGSAILE